MGPGDTVPTDGTKGPKGDTKDPKDHKAPKGDTTGPTGHKAPKGGTKDPIPTGDTTDHTKASPSSMRNRCPPMARN